MTQNRNLSVLASAVLKSRVFGHNVCGPLKVLKECFMADHSPKTNVVDFVSRCRERLKSTSVFARQELSASQEVMKKQSGC